MSKTPKTLSVTECHQLLDALLPKDATTKQHRKGVRNYTMAIFMLDAGLRVGEVVKLQWQQLWLFDVPVRAIALTPDQTKNRKPRTIPLSTRAQNAIVEMSKSWWRRSGAFPSIYAFSKTTNGSSLTTRQVERIIRRAAMLSIGRPIHPHVLRHTFGTRLMKVTNARIVQELLGHEHMSSTQIYTHPDQEDLENAIDQIGQGEAKIGLAPTGLASSAGSSNCTSTGNADSNVG